MDVTGLVAASYNLQGHYHACPHPGGGSRKGPDRPEVNQEHTHKSSDILENCKQTQTKTPVLAHISSYIVTGGTLTEIQIQGPIAHEIRRFLFTKSSHMTETHLYTASL